MEHSSLNIASYFIFPLPLLFGAAFLLCSITIFLLNTKDHISTIIISGLFSLLAVVNYSILKAPDVAITEVAVGSALSTIFFILSLKLLGKRIKRRPNEKLYKWTIVLFFIILWIGFCFILKDLSAFGDSNAPVHQEISAYYIENTINDFAIPNIVTAILGGYRGMDTLFETTVILVASLGVFYILKRR